MSYNGAGVFSIDTVGNPVVYDTEISHTMFNNTMTEIAAGLSTALCRDGQSSVTADIPLGTFRITQLGTATSRLDAMNAQAVINSTGVYISSVAGTADVITASPTPALTAYAAGMHYVFVAGGTNTTAVTINISSLGAKDITKQGAVALSAGDIVSGQLTHIMYDGTRFILMGPIYAEGSWTPAVGGSAAYTTQIGRYTKIGRTVHVTCVLTINTIGTGSTSVISGLPFTSANISADQALAVSDFASLAASVVWIGARVNTNATTIQIRSLTAAGASAGTNAVFGNSASVTLTGSYII